MIRNRRGQTALEFTKRHVYAIPIDFSWEQEAYDKLTLVMRERPHVGRLECWCTVTHHAAARDLPSPLAAAVTLQKLMDNTGMRPWPNPWKVC